MRSSCAGDRAWPPAARLPAACALVLAAACGPARDTTAGPRGSQGPPGASAFAAARAEPAAPLPAGWQYRVIADAGAERLRVEATFAAGAPAELSVDDGAERFVHDVQIQDGALWRPLEPEGDSWFAPACTARGCRVRYRFDLAEAAAAIDDDDVAKEVDGALLAPPSTWLLHPLRPEPGQPFVMRVSTPPGTSFVTGVLPSASGEPGAFQADVSDIYETPFSAFGAIRSRKLQVPGGAVELAMLPGRVDVGEDALAKWVMDSARAVAGYYGRFPIRHALVLLRATRGSGFGYARTLGNGGATILAPIGRATTATELGADWVMTHEMVHLAFPNLPRQHVWLEEGLATYVEPIARARAGLLADERVWRGFLRGMPNGLPQAGDRGLDNTPTWGRRYWGGAIFCLLADLEIRRRTDNTRSLDDALRGIVAAGGSIAVRWPLSRALAEGDRATGVPVLTELHAKMGAAPVPVDLEALWRRLGVSLRAGRVAFDEGAPLAAVRRAMTARP